MHCRCLWRYGHDQLSRRRTGFPANGSTSFAAGSGLLEYTDYPRRTAVDVVDPPTQSERVPSYTRATKPGAPVHSERGPIWTPAGGRARQRKTRANRDPLRAHLHNRQDSESTTKPARPSLDLSRDGVLDVRRKLLFGILRGRRRTSTSESGSGGIPSA